MATPIASNREVRTKTDTGAFSMYGSVSTTSTDLMEE